MGNPGCNAGFHSSSNRSVPNYSIVKHRFRVAASSIALALNSSMPFFDDIQRIDRVCRCIATGRALARQLAAALRKHDYGETEFRLLWLLRERSDISAAASTEQSALAEQLGISPAQVSAIVEKLRTQRAITPVTDRKDRRRQLWQLTASGREGFEAIVAAVGPLTRGWVFPESIDGHSRSHREDAA